MLEADEAGVGRMERGRARWGWPGPPAKGAGGEGGEYSLSAILLEFIQQ